MDKHEGTSPSPTNLEELLRSTPLFLLVGCPDWCEWEARGWSHSHVSDGVAELAVADGLGDDFPAVLEVRHAAAPATPKSA